MNTRGLSVLLAISVAIVTSAFISLIPDISLQVILLAFAIPFSATYLLVFIILEFIIFRDIQRINQMLSNLKKEDLSFITSGKKSWFNPLSKVNRELYDYAAVKQREIDELRKLEAFRKEFIADVSHELKTPIFAAQGYIHTLMDGAVKDKSVRNKFLKRAAKSLDGLDLLVQDLLILSQMESGDIKMQAENFDIVFLIKEVAEQMEGKASKRKVEITAPIEESELYVKGDQKRINRVLINLVSNAIKYSREDGKVSIYLEKSKDEVKVFVQDNGEGISKEHLGRIFERFYRVEKSRSKDWGGTGLGLAIVKHIIEGHGSRVHVTSSPGKGSTFSFKLPKGKSPEDALEPGSKIASRHEED